MIERIEVLRGGGSALFGANAIGGTINIITREPIRNSGDFTHTLTSINGSGALENNTTFNASLVDDTHRAGIAVFGHHRYRDGYDIDGDGFQAANFEESCSRFSCLPQNRPLFKLSLDYQNSMNFAVEATDLTAL